MTLQLTPAEYAAALVAFRDGTLGEIVAWQIRLGVLADGVPGPQTRGALEAVRPPGIPTPARIDFSRFDRARFFDEVRRTLFDSALTTAQVSGMEHLLDVWAREGTSDYRHLAYAFATSYHETGRRMQPVREGFATTDAGARAAVKRLYDRGVIRRNYALPVGGLSYYGRSDVQLTHPENYDRMGKLLKLPLLANPDLALDPEVSKRILVEGLTRGASTRGDFTGKAVEDCIHGRVCDYPGCRRVVNGTDKAHLIAVYAFKFDRALVAAGAPSL